MKRIISILTILAVLICSTGFAGIHCEPPAVFGALRDTFTDTDDPTFTDTTAFSEDYDLFLLSDTDDDKNKETSDESEKDNISDDNDTVDTGSDTSGDAEDSGRSDDSGDPGNEESPEDTENSENPDDPDNTDDPTDKEEEEPEDEPAPPVFIDLPISDDYFSQTQYSFYNVGKYLQYRNETFTEQQSKPGIDLDVARGRVAQRACGRSCNRYRHRSYASRSQG